MDTPLTAVLLCCFVVEDRNFALFNFVNEQNNEAEALRDQISQVSVPLSDSLIVYLVWVLETLHDPYPALYSVCIV